MTSMQQRLDMQKRPKQLRMLYQEWRNLFLLHWRYDKEKIQQTLPPGLFVDTFQGDAYLSIVPFFIQNLKLGYLPTVPFFSEFIEVNARTYVHDRNGVPGVWFYSLDINSCLITSVARKFFFLPYADTELSAETSNNKIQISGKRKDGTANMGFIFQIGDNQNYVPQSDTLDFFLLERYALFAFTANQLYIQKIHHVPYATKSVELIKYNCNLLEINGLQTNPLPDFIHYCTGLDTDFFPMEKLS